MPSTRCTLICWIAIWVALLLVACQATKRVALRVDGQERVLESSAETVGDLLREAGVSLGQWDRVEPSEWAELQRNNTITIIRGREEKAEESLPFERQVIKDEGLPEGEMRLLQAGKPGTLERIYRISYDGPQELERRLISTRVLAEPRPEILAVGVTPLQTVVPITGTIAYLANGNACIIRNNSGDKRPVTFSGDLDGRVFDLSPEGQNLLFTATPGQLDETGSPPPFNELWALDTRILQEAPRPLGITNVLYAEWAPQGHQIAYSTAEATLGPPGWRARNDLWIMDTQTLTRTQVVAPWGGGLYGWWGSRYAWSPTGDRIAYAAPDGIGVIQIPSGQRTPLLRFPVFHTYGEWVWTSQVSWSPEGRFLAAVAHGLSSDGSPAEESHAFDLWILDTLGPASVPIATQVGMWSNPRWSHAWSDAYGQPHVDLAYGVSQVETLSQYGLYDLYVMDRDGSNRARLLPPEEGAPGLPTLELAWSPATRALACIWGDDLYLLDLRRDTLVPLTQSISCLRVAWGGQSTAPPAGALP